ncbi:hypothetical protein COO60DRAFT_1520529 [Scenedesmus sp. NREL 46B-D3]|nr:hypothetical protein COO60DRAFT_1520529 [Scenedesmus sp. NREL 46B-D3]
MLSGRLVVGDQREQCGTLLSCCAMHVCPNVMHVCNLHGRGVVLWGCILCGGGGMVLCRVQAHICGALALVGVVCIGVHSAVGGSSAVCRCAACCLYLQAYFPFCGAGFLWSGLVSTAQHVGCGWMGARLSAFELQLT